jgi:hypothetical protein
MKANLSGNPNLKLRDVETASNMMRRYYRIEKETMRAMAGYLPKMNSWPGKKLLARHIWFDAMHADLLRSRTLDLRYPRLDVEDDLDTNMLSIFEKIPTAPTDEHFLISIYVVIKPAIVESLQQYLKGADSLADAPTFVYFERIIYEIQMELDEFHTIMDIGDLNKRTEHVQWKELIIGCISSCGGIEGPDKEIHSDYAEFMDRPEYILPMEGGRELSWEKAVTQVSPRKPRNAKEEQIRVAIDHANEVWASETSAALIWEYKNKPWSLYFDAARWCYDEMRHAMMGVERLSKMGLEIGIDYPMVPDHWRTFREKGIKYLVLLLHRLEQNGPVSKMNLKKWFLEEKDFAAAQDCDYDWADESGHISYGLEWVKTLFPEWTKQQIIEEGNQIAEDWGSWIRNHHTKGTHGYEIFLERMDRKLTK